MSEDDGYYQADEADAPPVAFLRIQRVWWEEVRQLAAEGAPPDVIETKARVARTQIDGLLLQEAAAVAPTPAGPPSVRPIRAAPIQVPVTEDAAMRTPYPTVEEAVASGMISAMQDDNRTVFWRYELETAPGGIIPGVRVVENHHGVIYCTRLRAGSTPFITDDAAARPVCVELFKQWYTDVSGGSSSAPLGFTTASR